MRVLLASSLLTILIAMPALAEDAAADTETREIIVTGTKDGYQTIETTSGTKTNTPLLDVPQAISVVTSEQIADQNIRSMADLVRLIPGISAGQGEGHRDQITLRGNNSTADFFIDGLRDDVQYFRSFYNIDRVEAHKGPNAMVFGRGGGGGIINRITKGALDTSLLEGSASVNSFGAWSVATDINQPFSGNAAVRLNAFYEELNSHRDRFDGNRLGINPVVGATLGDWKLQLGYEYVHDARVVDRGIPSQSGRPAPGLRDRFFGVDGVNRSRLDAHLVSFKSTAKLTDELSFWTQALYADYDKIYTNVFPVTAISNGSVQFEAYRDPTKRQNFIGQANLEWRGSTGGIEHILLAGVEYTDQDTHNERINGFFNPTVLTAANRRSAPVSLAGPLTIPQVFFVAGSWGDSNRTVLSNVSQKSAYLQDQIKLGDYVEVIAGLRYDSLKTRVTTARTTTVTAVQKDNLWSPRAGLIFKPVPQASLYVSYAKSYLPQSGDQFLTLDATGTTLKPEKFENLEIGAKWNIRPDLTATLALYQLDRSNTRATINNLTVQSGEQRSKGIEFGLNGRITPDWQVAIGYAHTLASITSTISAAVTAGRKVAQVPKHQLSLWNRYELTPKLGVGMGLYAQAKSFASISNAVTLPAYARVDGAIFYKLSEKFEAQINLENIGGTSYFPVAHNDNNISTGAPFNARFTVNVRF